MVGPTTTRSALTLLTSLSTEESPSNPPELPRRGRRRAADFALHPWIWAECALVAIVGAVALALRNSYVFSYPIHENTDYAANSILVNQAVRFHLLIGNYSREGFNHPGPAFLYVLAFGQDVFYSILHVVPTQFNGQLIGIYLLNGLMVALATLVIYRHVRTRWVAVLGIGVDLIITGAHVAWASAWMPYLYIAPFLLLTIAGVSVALGALEDLPIYTLAGALLVHGHVAFIGFVGAYTLGVGAVFAFRRYRRRPEPALASSARRAIWISAGIVGLFLVPIVVNLCLHWPAQWGQYWDYFHSNGHSHPHTIRQVISYDAVFWGGDALSEWLLVASAAAGAILTAFDRNSRRRSFLFGLLVAVAAMSVLVSLYALKGVDYLSFTYTGYFYYVIPPLVVTVLAIELATYVPRVVPRLGQSSPALARVGSVVVVAVVAAVVIIQPSFYWTYRGDPQLPAVASKIKDAPARADRPVVMDLGIPGLPASDWPDTVGLLVQASRDNYTECVGNSAWTFMMTIHEICSAKVDQTGWHLTVEPVATAAPAGDRMLFQDDAFKVYES